jgi:pyridoxamine 5'-phosphate oxidase
MLKSKSPPKIRSPGPKPCKRAKRASSATKSKILRTPHRSSTTSHIQLLHDAPIQRETFAPEPIAQFTTWFKDVVSVQPTMPERMTVSTIKMDNGTLIPSSRPVLMKHIVKGDEMVSTYGIMSSNLDKHPTLSTPKFFPTTTDPAVFTTSTQTPFDADVTKELLAAGGFTFVSNYQSNKGQQAEEFPHVSLTFHWVEIERVVRIEGKMHKVPEPLSMHYHLERPRDSRVSALASRQSRPITNHQDLEYRYSQLDEVLKTQQYSRLLDPADEIVYSDVTKDAIIKPDGVSADEFVPKPTHWGGYVIIPHQVEFWQGRPSRFHERIVYSRSGDLEKGFTWQTEYLSP